MKTTIQISKDTLDRLKLFQEHNRESYDFTINFILDKVVEEVLSNEEIDEIQESLEQVRSGEVYSIREVAKEFGVELD